MLHTSGTTLTISTFRIQIPAVESKNMFFIDHSGRKGLQLALVLLLLCPLIAIAQAPAGANQPQADNQYLAGAVLWQQASGERRALAYQIGRASCRERVLVAV